MTAVQVALAGDTAGVLLLVYAAVLGVRHADRGQHGRFSWPKPWRWLRALRRRGGHELPADGTPPRAVWLQDLRPEETSAATLARVLEGLKAL